jgi:hypothetical protein
MKKLKFVVTIEFADDIHDDNEIDEVGKNVINAISTQCFDYGLVPDNSETYTKSITVVCDSTGTEHFKNIY